MWGKKNNSSQYWNWVVLLGITLVFLVGCNSQQTTLPPQGAPFSLALASTTVTTPPNSGIVIPFNLERKNGFDHSIRLEVADAPAGIRVSFSDPMAAAQSSTQSLQQMLLTVNVDATVAAGSYPLVIKALCDDFSHEVQVTVQVEALPAPQPPAPPAPAPPTPAPPTPAPPAPVPPTEPQLSIANPQQGAVIGSSSVTITGTVNAVVTRLSYQLNAGNVQQASLSAGTFSVTVTGLHEGANSILLKAEDAAGRSGTVALVVTRQGATPQPPAPTPPAPTPPAPPAPPTEPQLSIANPQQGAVIGSSSVTVSGTVTHAVTRLSYRLNGGSPSDVSTGLSASGFEFMVNGLAEGQNTIVVTARSASGSERSATIILTRSAAPAPQPPAPQPPAPPAPQPPAPQPPAEPQVVITSPTSGATVNTRRVSIEGTVGNAISLTHKVNNDAPRALAVQGSRFNLSVDLDEGQNTITLTARNSSGTERSASITLTYLAPAAPPPAPPAPPAPPPAEPAPPPPPAPPAVTPGSPKRNLSAGDAFALVIHNGGVSGWGDNVSQQLGNGSTSLTRPVALAGLSGITDIRGGQRHALALDSSGRVWSWGHGGSGQLGWGPQSLYGNQPTPRQLELRNIEQVAAGSAHSLALQSDGTVWAWGNNRSGQLGEGGVHEAYSSPVKVVNLSDVVAVGAGWNHSVALKRDGTVWAWGLHEAVILGDGSRDSQKRQPVQVLELRDVVQIAVGERHTLALRNDGTVWAWGYNLYGQLGDGSFSNRNRPWQVQGLTDVKQIAAGGAHSLAIKNDGTVWAWGFNASGQLGNGSTSNQNRPVQLQGLRDAHSLAAGRDFSLVRLNDGSVWAWGFNASGQLGDGSTQTRTSPVRSAF